MKRTVSIATEGSHLSVANHQLVVKGQGRPVAQVPLEDLGVLVIESQAVTITSAAVSTALSFGCCILFCAKSHEPQGLLLPLSSNTLSSKRIQAQALASKVLKKNLWKRIISRKILCQAHVVKGEDHIRKLKTVSGQVRSGDTTNREAVAARTYWRALFGDNFRRARHGLWPNPALNYGYAVVRAAIGRAIVAAGLSPSLGIHHKNQYNPFCLADDLLELYRPWVDRRTRIAHDRGHRTLNPESRELLLGVLTDSMWVGGNQGPILAGIEKTAASLVQCYLPDKPHLGTAIGNRVKKLLIPDARFADANSGV